MKTVPCHRCNQFPTIFTHDGAAYLTGNRECITCNKFVERYDKPEQAIARWNHTVTIKKRACIGRGLRMVPADTYNQILQSGLCIDRGPCGHEGGVIKIMMPVYGAVGLYVECPFCKASTAVYPVTECVYNKENGGMATPYSLPVIEQSMQMAIDEWNQNGASRKGENHV